MESSHRVNNNGRGRLSHAAGCTPSGHSQASPISVVIETVANISHLRCRRAEGSAGDADISAISEECPQVKEVNGLSEADAQRSFCSGPFEGTRWLRRKTWGYRSNAHRWQWIKAGSNCLFLAAVAMLEEPGIAGLGE